MIDMEAHIRAVVDSAPPPTPEQIARIQLIIAGPRPGEPMVWQPVENQSPAPLPLAEPVTPRARPGEGWIYVIEFSSGTVKVGCTGRNGAPTGQRRIDQHRREAARHGVTITRQWLSPPHSAWEANERALIEHCLDAGSTRVGGSNEYFTSLDFDQAAAFAAHLAGDPE